MHVTKKQVWPIISLLAVAAFQVACFNPEYPDGKIACGTNDSCPPELVCNKQTDRCERNSGSADGGSLPDGGTPGIDAQVPVCDPGQCGGVNGTCSNDDCVIACENPNSCVNLRCPDNHKCVISCAQNSCDGITCSGAAACSITCTGRDSCKNEIQCGTGPCDVRCMGVNSCPGTVNCSQSCGCDVTCSVDEACANTPVCPPGPDACSDDNGCTSMPARCPSCSL